jgi:hypothetical protein
MHRALAIFGLFCCMCGTLALFPSNVTNAQSRTVTDVRLDNLERTMGETQGYGERLAHLEDISAVHTTQLGEIQWWGRWIGVALLAAVLDKFLALIGLSCVSEKIAKRQRERRDGGGEE